MKAHFPILFVGAIAVPLDPQSTQKDLKYFLKHSASKLVFTSELHQELFNKIKTRIELVNEKLFTKKSEKIEPKQLKPFDPASILYT